MSLIYHPQEDSYLLKEVLEETIPLLLKKNQNLKCLEIGIGSGIQLETLKNLGVKNLFGIDINEDSVNHCKLLGFNCINSNLFEKIKDKFDLIIFNPPYLPENSEEDNESKLITTGGKNGSEIINLFLSEAENYLYLDGKVFLLISSLTKKINWFNYKKKLLKEKNFFFEKLKIYELKNK